MLFWVLVKICKKGTLAILASSYCTTQCKRHPDHLVDGPAVWAITVYYKKIALPECTESIC